MPYRLYRTDSDAPLCDLTDEQQELLADLLEPEEDGGAIWLDANTIDYLKDSGLDDALCESLRTQVPEGDGLDIAWRPA